MDGIGVTAQADEWNKWGRTQLNTATTLVKCVSVCQVIVFHKRIFKKAALALIIVQMHLISFFWGGGVNTRLWGLTASSRERWKMCLVQNGSWSMLSQVKCFIVGWWFLIFGLEESRNTLHFGTDEQTQNLHFDNVPAIYFKEISISGCQSHYSLYS